MIVRGLVLGVVIVLCSGVAASVDNPTPGAVVERMIEAAGGEDAFQRLGVLEMAVHEEETTSEGRRELGSYTAWAYTPQPDTLRMELSPRVVVACHKGAGWATTDGEVDTRPQTPRMAVGTIHQKLFPLLLPFSLATDGVQVHDEIAATTFDGEAAWRFAVSFGPMFFVAPVMNTDWSFTVRRSDYALVAVEFLPPVEYRTAQNEGVRYRYLQHAEIQGVRLPTQVLLDGIGFDGVETGHVRVTKIEPSVRGSFDPELFIDPRRLERLEEGAAGVE